LGAQVDYQHFELEAAYLTLSSNIVTTAINVASWQAQVKATHELIAAQEKILQIVQGQFHRGGASGVDVYTQETQLAQTRATLPPLEQQVAQGQHLLAVLLGSLPSESALPTFDLNTLVLPTVLPLSLPSALAHQRPDIRAAEALLHAACAQIGVATANLYPQITLNGSYGWAQDSPANLFTHNNVVWTIGTQIMQPLYNGGSLRAKRRAAVAGFEQAAAQYRQTVLQSFQNVADTLRAIENDAKAFHAQQQAEKAAKATFLLTAKQFRLGGVSYLSLLNAEKQYQQSNLGRIQAQAARYNDTVALFQALGGGWWNRGNHEPATNK
jgi:NodT family efflux transporter outer membrane factor (OMF) lipoprotein